MVYALVSVEIMALLICVILWLGNHMVEGRNDEKRKAFDLVVAANVIGLASDMLSWIMDGMVQWIGALYVINILSMVAGFFASLSIIWYIFVNISIRSNKRQHMPLAIWIYFLAVTIWTIVGSLTGSVFTLENGVYEDGPLYLVYSMMNAVLLVYLVIVIFRHRKGLMSSDMLAIFSYLIFPVAAMIVNLVFPMYSFVYPAMSLSLLIIYILIQTEQQTNLLHQEMEASMIARHDALTGLYNRRAFTDMLEESDDETIVGVIFCDLNGLKYTNDTLGHAAGDGLLCQFAEMLLGSFRRDDLYRLSGDEFLVLMRNISAEDFEHCAKRLRYRIGLMEVPIASMGTAYGVGRMADLVAKAEEEMYRDKQRYYEKYPNHTRK